jgi:hypothetical protein
LSPSVRISVLLALIVTLGSITAAIASSQPFAATTITLTLNPANPTANNIVQFQGTLMPSTGTSQEIVVNLYRNSGCDISHYLFNMEGASDSTGSSYSIDVRLGIAYLSYIGPGNYSAFSYISNTPNIRSSCVNFTVSEAVPEFSVSPPIFIILALIACGLMLRRSINKKRNSV